jgi:thioredoxin-like negative regulator of GroEL
MKWYQHVILISVATVCAVKAEVPAGWSTNVATLSAVLNQPGVLFFTASWCGPCQLMVRTTLTNAAVQRALESIQRVAVDIDTQPDLAEKHAIRAVPTFVLLTASGEEVDRTTGYAPSEEFLPWLTNGLARAQAAFAQHARSLEELKAIDQNLSATNGNPGSVTKQLLNLCADRDPVMAGAAAARLKQIAARDPALILGGLNDPRLAARICVANILRNQLGESFDVDPWSDAGERARQVEQWRQQLAK